MTKTELIDAICDDTKQTRKVVKTTVDSLFETITKAVTSLQEVKIPSFGKFYTKRVNDKKARNPITAETIIVPEHNVARFKFSDNIKKAVATR